MQSTNSPIDAVTPEIRRYWMHLGRFVSVFSLIEKTMFTALAVSAGVSHPVARAVFSGVKTDTAMRLVNRVFQVVDTDPGTKADGERCFAQLGLINKARNDIVHHGTIFGEGEDHRVSNDWIALKPERVYEFPVSVPILDAMTEDLWAIFIIINHHVASHLGQPEAWRESYEKFAKTPWRYKPPQQGAKQTKNPKGSPKQRRARKS